MVTAVFLARQKRKRSKFQLSFRRRLLAPSDLPCAQHIPFLHQGFRRMSSPTVTIMCFWRRSFLGYYEIRAVRRCQFQIAGTISGLSGRIAAADGYPVGAPRSPNRCLSRHHRVIDVNPPLFAAVTGLMEETRSFVEESSISEGCGDECESDTLTISGCRLSTPNFATSVASKAGCGRIE